MESDLIVHEREGLVGIHQRESFEFVEDVCEFYRVFFRNLRRAGKLKNRFFTDRFVPAAQASAVWCWNLDAAISR